MKKLTLALLLNTIYAGGAFGQTQDTTNAVRPRTVTPAPQSSSPLKRESYGGAVYNSSGRQNEQRQNGQPLVERQTSPNASRVTNAAQTSASLTSRPQTSQSNTPTNTNQPKVNQPNTNQSNVTTRPNAPGTSPTNSNVNATGAVNPAINNSQSTGVITTTTPISNATTATAQDYAYLPPIALKPLKPIAPNKVEQHLEEAKKQLRSRVQLTAYTATPNIYFVTLAALDVDANKVHTLTIPKNVFIKRGSEIQVTTQQGLPVRFRTLRPNYVNTQVAVFDLTGRQLIPLVVEYPLEKFGSYRETAYYTSAHPVLLTPELVKDGQTYVRTMVELAAKRLKDKGKFIAPEILDIAERLCIVEHTDHQRFLTENRKALFDEVYALFALNRLDTYRYSVSTAGAGGMVQMIPATYQMVRRQHPSVGLNPDFVAGMRNHGNALEAMLLYMQDTWRDLQANYDVADAYYTGLAARHELVAAGYNSNPAKLGRYINRGASSWRSLIPRETQMYLQIYSSFESLIPMKKRVEDKTPPRPVNTVNTASLPGVIQPNTTQPNLNQPKAINGLPANGSNAPANTTAPARTSTATPPPQ